MKKVGSLVGHELVQAAKMIFADYGLPKKKSLQMLAWISHQDIQCVLQVYGP